MGQGRSSRVFGRSQDGILLASRLLLAAALLPTGIARALNVSGFALALAGVERGAQIVRVHDVAETVQAIRVWRGLRDAALVAR